MRPASRQVFEPAKMVSSLKASPTPPPVLATLSQSIQSRILADIRSGALTPGTKLEEKDLAARYGVSRTPVREALRHLAATGVVEFRPRYGVFIADFSTSLWQDILEVLAELEAGAARHAANRMTLQERAGLRAIQDQLAAVVAAGNAPAFDRQNAALHQMVWAGAHNATLSNSIERLRSRALPYTRLQYITEKAQGVSSHLEHEAIVRAITLNQPELAYQAMREHVLRAGALSEAQNPAG